MGYKQKVRRERQRQQKAKQKNATPPVAAAAAAALAAAQLADPSTPSPVSCRLLCDTNFYIQKEF